MATANITAPTTTQQGDFSATVTFLNAVTDFGESKITITAVSGNGITGITFQVMGSGTTYNIMFYLPDDVEGEFEIDITGMVTPDGSSTPEPVTVTARRVVYDNISNVSASFGTVEYRDDGVIWIPVTFAETVIAPGKSTFRLSKVSGDNLVGFQYRLVGRGTDFKVIVTVPPGKSGRFKVEAVGHVFKGGSKPYVRDNVVMTPTALTVPYSTIEPRIVNWDIPANFDLGSPLDVRVAYNIRVTGWTANNTITEHGIFILEGANLGTPTPYKWVGTSPPNFKTPVPADLSGTNWQALDPPPAGTPTPGMNGWAEDGIQWHGEEGQYFLIRFADPQETGIFNLTPRDGGVRGPVS